MPDHETTPATEPALPGFTRVGQRYEHASGAVCGPAMAEGQWWAVGADRKAVTCHGSEAEAAAAALGYEIRHEGDAWSWYTPSRSYAVADYPDAETAARQALLHAAAQSAAEQRESGARETSGERLEPALPGVTVARDRRSTARAEPSTAAAEQAIASGNEWEALRVSLGMTPDEPNSGVIDRLRSMAAGGGEPIDSTGLALLRIIATFPWMAAVADSGFDAETADVELFRAARRIALAREPPAAAEQRESGAGCRSGAEVQAAQEQRESAGGAGAAAEPPTGRVPLRAGWRELPHTRNGHPQYTCRRDNSSGGWGFAGVVSWFGGVREPTQGWHAQTDLRVFANDLDAAMRRAEELCPPGERAPTGAPAEAVPPGALADSQTAIAPTIAPAEAVPVPRVRHERAPSADECADCSRANCDMGVMDCGCPCHLPKAAAEAVPVAGPAPCGWPMGDDAEIVRRMRRTRADVRGPRLVDDARVAYMHLRWLVTNSAVARPTLTAYYAECLGEALGEGVPSPAPAEAVPVAGPATPLVCPTCHEGELERVSVERCNACGDVYPDPAPAEPAPCKRCGKGVEHRNHDIVLSVDGAHPHEPAEPAPAVAEPPGRPDLCPLCRYGEAYGCARDCSDVQAAYDRGARDLDAVRRERDDMQGMRDLARSSARQWREMVCELLDREQWNSAPSAQLEVGMLMLSLRQWFDERPRIWGKLEAERAARQQAEAERDKWAHACNDARDERDKVGHQLIDERAKLDALCRAVDAYDAAYRVSRDGPEWRDVVAARAAAKEPKP